MERKLKYELLQSEARPLNPVNLRIADFPDDMSRARLKDIILVFDNLDEEDSMEHRIERQFPVKTDDLFSLHIVRGEMKLIINMEEVTVSAYQTLTITPDSVFQKLSVSDDIKFFCFTMSPDLHDDLLSNVGITAGLPDLYARYYVVQGNMRSVQQALQVYNIIKKELLEPDYPTKKLVIERYCEVLFLKNVYMFRGERPKLPTAVTRKEQIYREFLRLLEKHFREERSISFYAGQLFLTPKYLSTVIKEVSGKHGSQWIDEYVVLEAKALLRQGRYSVKQIADMLNFPSQSMFGRFFKKMTGMSPKKYKTM